MEQQIKAYYSLVKDLKSSDEFEKEITTRKQEYDSLFTDELIAYLIVDELERNKQKTIPIKDINAGMECTIQGTISEVSETKRFTRKNNSKGKFRKCIITDESGSIPVILWNEDTDLIDQKHMENGSLVTIINGYTKKGYHGMEINVGRWSKIKITKNDNVKPHNTHTKERTRISGIIKKIESTNIFFRDDGSEGFITKVIVKTSQGNRSLILWDDQVKTIQQYHLGDTITVNNVSYRYVNGEQELHVNGNAEIQS